MLADSNKLNPVNAIDDQSAGLANIGADPRALTDLRQESASWQADLSLRFEHKNDATRMAHCRHSGPLYVQKPFFPEGKRLPHIYILHPPGGVVSGDCLSIDVDIGEQSAALFTTPGAGRVYRARADNSPQGQHVAISVAADASAEWFPLENIVYPGANADLSTTIRLAHGGTFIGWDVTSLGLPAQKADFNVGELSQRLEVWVDDCPKIIEHLRLGREAPLLAQAVGLQCSPINATLIAGPFFASSFLSNDEGDGRGEKKMTEEALNTLLAQLRELAESKRPVDAKSQCGITLVNGFIVARYLGLCSESARQLFTAFWQVLRPILLQRDACLPRIWST